ncbi:MAG: hypothetical protein ABSH20_19730, partial [Tepidisphaeraceae bacterium]
GTGNDSLSDTLGDDQFYGGEGNDTINCQDGEPYDYVYDVWGTNTITNDTTDHVVTTVPPT